MLAQQIRDLRAGCRMAERADTLGDEVRGEVELGGDRDVAARGHHVRPLRSGQAIARADAAEGLREPDRADPLDTLFVIDSSPGRELSPDSHGGEPETPRIQETAHILRTLRQLHFPMATREDFVAAIEAAGLSRPIALRPDENPGAGRGTP